jgi:hypothetical protein
MQDVLPGENLPSMCGCGWSRGRTSAAMWPHRAACVIVVAAAVKAGYDTSLTSGAFAVRRCACSERERNVDGE